MERNPNQRKIKTDRYANQEDNGFIHDAGSSGESGIFAVCAWRNIATAETCGENGV